MTSLQDDIRCSPGRRMLYANNEPRIHNKRGSQGGGDGDKNLKNTLVYHKNYYYN